MAGKITLEVTTGPLTGRRFEFAEHDTFVFGRDPACHAHLSEDDTTASRHHFLLEANPPHARLRDLGSLNGTHVNGTRYGGRPPGVAPSASPARQPEVDLAEGDVIRVGATSFVVRIEGGGALAATLPAEVAGNPVIAGYEIQHKLGEGGMGAVFRARRVADGAGVAIKTMRAQVAVSSAARAVFLREIEVTRQLRHPNIVAVFDHGEANGTFYFVMELCPGGSIDAVMTKSGGRLALGEALAIALPALEGLAHAHQQGFVHRDLKPQNILLDEARRPRVSDFGLAKSFAKAGLSGMTATGSIAGTPLFMPREQLTNFKFAPPASDVWSFGATLYFMLTGHSPRDFVAGMDPIQLILRGATTPVRARDPSIPGAIAAVIDRSLADRVEDRYATASDLYDALRAAAA